MKLMPFFLVFFLCLAAAANAETTYTPSSKTVCNKGTCTISLYSGTMFVQEKDKWLPVEQAKSLKGVWNVQALKTDEKYGFRVDDFNYSSIRLCVRPDMTSLNRNIPIKYCNLTQDARSMNAQPCKEFMAPKFADTKEVCYTFNMKESLLAYNFTFGNASTTIVLQDANTENLEDTYISEDFPDQNSGSKTTLITTYIVGDENVTFIKFNISQAIKYDIVSAVLRLKSTTTCVRATTHMWNVTNLTWTEDTITYNNHPMILNLLSNNMTPGTEMTWNATSKVLEAKAKNQNNVSFAFNLSGLAVCKYYSKETTSQASYRPYLNITYPIQSIPTWFKNQSTLSTEYNPTNINRLSIIWNTTQPLISNVSVVYIETNLTNTATNYTPTNTSDVFNYTRITAIRIGRYYWRSWAKDSFYNIWNVTPKWFFEIVQNTTNPLKLNFTIDGIAYTNVNISTTSTKLVTINGGNQYPQSGTMQLWINGTQYSMPRTQTWGVGTYLIRVNTSGNANYTSNVTGALYQMVVTSGVEYGGGGGGGGGGKPYTIVTTEACNVTIYPRFGMAGYGVPGEQIAPFKIIIYNKNISQRFELELPREISDYCSVDFSMVTTIPPWGQETFTIRCKAPEDKLSGNIIIKSDLGCEHGIPIDIGPGLGVWEAFSNAVMLIAAGELSGFTYPILGIPFIVYIIILFAVIFIVILV